MSNFTMKIVTVGREDHLEISRDPQTNHEAMQLQAFITSYYKRKNPRENRFPGKWYNGASCLPRLQKELNDTVIGEMEEQSEKSREIWEDMLK